MITVISAVISFLLGIGIIGGYTKKVLNVLKEINDVIASVKQGLEDGTLTADEVATIIAEAKEVIPALKEIITK